MRSPRVVGDYHVDRREVQVQRCTEPTRTNSPITFVSSFRSSLSRHTGSRLWGSGNTKRRRRGGATPLPIPNREVKPASADGTARKGGRAGGCRLWGATTDRSMVTSCRRRPFLFCTPLPSFLPVLAAAETGSKCTCRINVLFRWKKHGRSARHASVLSTLKKHGSPQKTTKTWAVACLKCSEKRLRLSAKLPLPPANKDFRVYILWARPDLTLIYYYVLIYNKLPL